jgi:acid phosphatase
MNRALGIGSALVLLTSLSVSGASAHDDENHGDGSLRGVDHIVVIYEENHSFDNLFGTWPGVDGLAAAALSTQVGPDAARTPLNCLPQNDVNLTSPPLSGTDCVLPDGTTTQSHFPNAPFKIDDFIGPQDTTCPAPGAFFANGVLKGNGRPGGCTRDLVHRFYQEQYQIDGGLMDRYTTGSDAIGLTQGYYDTKNLPLYEYLHARGAPRYAVLDRFFQSAFGGSFLNHQWLISAQTPVYPNAPETLHSIIGPDGSPANYPLHPSTGLRDAALTVDGTADGTCPVAARVCGEWAVNTIQPSVQPFSSPGATKLPPQTHVTIGDELTAADVSWAWYAGGWDNAAGVTDGPGWTNGTTPGTCTDPNTATGAVYPNCPDKLFQFHHQPFNYYANYAPGTPGRAHLQDEKDFMAAAADGHLPAVSFVKPIGAENEHPGYASQSAGDSHLVDLIKAVLDGPDAQRTMIVVTYDEFGGQWDHVPPPTAYGVSDVWGPGTRIPAIVIARQLPGTNLVDSVSHDTTSILTTIEHRFGLKPLSSRDASVNDLSSVFKAHHGRD